MASWTAPKYDWVPNDGIANTDFNRIEENTQYLYDENTQRINTIILSGNAPTTTAVSHPPKFDCYHSSVRTPISINALAQMVRVILPVGCVLTLVNAKYYLYGTTHTPPDGRPGYNRLYVNSGSTNKWISNNYYGDESPYAEIRNNVGGAEAADFSLSVSLLNTDPDAVLGNSIYPFSGWTLKFEISESDTTTSTTSTTEEPA